MALDERADLERIVTKAELQNPNKFTDGTARRRSFLTGTGS